MSHPAQKKFCKYVRSLYPQFFKRVNVIDVGSQDINGNNRYLFNKSYYVGIDIHAGFNVDIVGRAHEVIDAILPKLEINYVWNPHLTRIEPTDQFDTIISTEALEHDKYIDRTLISMYNKLKPGGLMLITAGGDGRHEHGTADHFPELSPGTNDYYKNVSNKDFSDIVPASAFSVYYLAQVDKDFQFYGIKSP